MRKKNILGFIICVLLIAALAALASPAAAAYLPAPIAGILGDLHASQQAENAIRGEQLLSALVSLLLWGLAATTAGCALGSLKFKNKHADTLRVMLAKLLRLVLWLVGIVASLGNLGVDTTTILVSVGVVGIIVGFGAQSLIEDIITGLFIILEGDYAIGDIIAVDGFRGEVVSVGLRTLCIKDPGGNVRIINNSEIGSVVNLSDSVSTAVVMVPVSYEDPLESAEKALEVAFARLMEKNPDVFGEAPVYKGVDNLTETHIELMVTAGVKEEQIYDARRLIQREIRLSFEEAGLSVPTTV